ncbi:MAG: hypothetical protein AAB570_04080, partial [Patescibacteria group bacterium]
MCDTQDRDDGGIRMKAVGYGLTAVLLCAFSGCAAYTGPRAESTAYPPSNPPRPEPIPRTEVKHEVSTSQNDRLSAARAEINTNFAEAYTKRGRPMAAVVLFDAENSIVISPALVESTTSESAISSQANADASAQTATASVQQRRTTTASARPAGTTSPHQLQSWSDVQQVFFDTLRVHGVRIADPEMVTLTKMDKLLERTAQGVSLHTSELEALRSTLHFDVLFLVQEIRDGSDRFLQGRVWDLKDGTLIGAG